MQPTEERLLETYFQRQSSDEPPRLPRRADLGIKFLKAQGDKMQLAILESGNHFNAVDQGDGTYEVSIQPSATQEYLDYLSENQDAKPELVWPITGFPGVVPVKPSGQDRTVYVNFTSDSLDKIPATLSINLRDSKNADFASSFSLVIDKPTSKPSSGGGTGPAAGPELGPAPVWIPATADNLTGKDQTPVVGVGGSAFIDQSGFLHQPNGSVWKLAQGDPVHPKPWD